MQEVIRNEFQDLSILIPIFYIMLDRTLELSARWQEGLSTRQYSTCVFFRGVCDIYTFCPVVTYGGEERCMQDFDGDR
jgi:hypothetical protein